MQGQYTLALAYQGVSKYAWQTVGNVLALITGAIAAALYGNIGLKVLYINIVENTLKGPPLMSKKGRLGESSFPPRFGYPSAHHLFFRAVWGVAVILFWGVAYIIGSAMYVRTLLYAFLAQTKLTSLLTLTVPRSEPCPVWSPPSASSSSPTLSRLYSNSPLRCTRMRSGATKRSKLPVFARARSTLGARLYVTRDLTCTSRITLTTILPAYSLVGAARSSAGRPSLRFSSTFRRQSQASILC